MTKRRVIFPDPNIWTTRKETTVTINHADARRAMALISHRTQVNTDGVNAVIREAVDADRATELLLALLECYTPIVNILRTEHAQKAMGQLVVQLAEYDDMPDWRRASRAVIAAASRDIPTMLGIVDEANELHRCPQLLVSVCDVYGLLLPELSTDIGLNAISTWTARIAAEEGQQ